jgi:hypothetical protein
MYSFELSGRGNGASFLFQTTSQFMSREIQGKGFDSENDPANSYTVMGEGGCTALVLWTKYRCKPCLLSKSAKKDGVHYLIS